MKFSGLLHLHLVSDATGDTVRSAARACLVQFEEIETTEHFWVLVRSSAQMERVIEGIAKNPGIVLCTVVDEALRAALEDACRQMKVRYVPLLDPVIAAIANHVGGRSRGLPGRQHSLDAAYFDRIEAMHYTMAHDDGQGLATLHEADLVLVGVSRTSKTSDLYLSCQSGAEGGECSVRAGSAAAEIANATIGSAHCGPDGPPGPADPDPS